MPAKELGLRHGVVWRTPRCNRSAPVVKGLKGTDGFSPVVLEGDDDDFHSLFFRSGKWVGPGLPGGVCFRGSGLVKAEGALTALVGTLRYEHGIGGA